MERDNAFRIAGILIMIVILAMVLFGFRGFLIVGGIIIVLCGIFMIWAGFTIPNV